MFCPQKMAVILPVASISTIKTFLNSFLKFEHHQQLCLLTFSSLSSSVVIINLLQPRAFRIPSLHAQKALKIASLPSVLERTMVTLSGSSSLQCLQREYPQGLSLSNVYLFFKGSHLCLLKRCQGTSGETDWFCISRLDVRCHRGGGEIPQELTGK